MARDIEGEITYRVTATEVVQSGILGGLIGGVLMALVAMLWFAAYGGGFFEPMVLVAAGVLGVGALQADAAAVIAGVLVHLGVASLLGLVYAAAVRARPTLGGAFFAGLVYGSLVFVVMGLLILPVANPVMYDVTRRMLEWFFVFHLFYGGGLGLAPSIARLLHVRHHREVAAH